MTKKIFSTNWAGRPLLIEIGEIAKNCNGSVLVRYGETVILSTAVLSREIKDSNFLPLSITYEEKLYAVGKIPGGFIKREGRPTIEANLIARLIDRPIRPLIPKNIRNEIQVTNLVMSVEPDCSPALAAMIGSSLALSISDIPFNGPIAGVQIGRIKEKYILNPDDQQRRKSDIELTISGTNQSINMVEGCSKEVSENEIINSLLFGYESIKKIVSFQEDIISQIGKAKKILNFVEPDKQLKEEIFSKYYKVIKKIYLMEDHLKRENTLKILKENIESSYIDIPSVYLDEKKSTIMRDITQIIEDMERYAIRKLILSNEIRPDGRKIDEIRSLCSEVGVLPRTHGSGLFTRGETQVLSSCTLGSLEERQILDGISTEDSKAFMHHYNFPQFCVGSTGRNGPPGRREIGHGILGEVALKAVIPDDSEFPYTIRVVSEVLESNGSSSQASICSATLALLDAGVPIKSSVAGIAMGLIYEGDQYKILTDIQGVEDQLGDMDFKVAGTKNGITALQMDIKIKSITENIFYETLMKAKKARIEILKKLESTISKPRTKVSSYAPKIKVIKIKPSQIKNVIGKGGEVINKIIDETGVKIDISQEGRISIISKNIDMIKKAIKTILDLTKEIKVGETYLGTVVRIEKFGAFVNLSPGKDGLIHISELSSKRIDQVGDFLKIDEKILVKVINIDKNSRINLSRKALSR